MVFHPGTATTDALLKAIDEEIERLASRRPYKRGASPRSRQLVRGPCGGASIPSSTGRTLIGSIETIHGAAELIDELAPRLGAVSAADVAAAAADLAGQHPAILELQPAVR